MQDWTTTYNNAVSGFSSTEGKPLIAITGNFANETCTLAEGYYRSVVEAGGVPVIIPPRFVDGDAKSLTTTEMELLGRIDGIIFSGGGDIDPLLVGEEPVRELHSVTPERDEQELLLARMAYDRQIPMLGICKGIQVINAALGGTNWQDIYTQAPRPAEGGLLKHSQDEDRRFASHTVAIEDGSVLSSVFSKMSIKSTISKLSSLSMMSNASTSSLTLAVNSFHHQAVRTPASVLRVAAVAPDGIIEAVESNEGKSIVGVQWHPETFILRGSREMMPIFEWLVGEAAEFKCAKALHVKTLTLDSHCDTPMFFSQGVDFARRDPRLCVDLHKMTEGHLDATIMVAYLEQKERDEASLENATARANQLLTQIEEMAARNCTAVDIAYTPDDLWRLKAQGKRAIMLGIENGYAIGRDIANVEAFRRRGVVYMTLCHNGNNDICGSAKPKTAGLSESSESSESSEYSESSESSKTTGVTPFGEQVIKEMNRVGMMVDLSHASEQSFYDALAISSTPIVCSHSSCRALCDHPRNLTDDQLRALAQAGGVAQVTLYHGFLRKDSPQFVPGPMQPDEATVLDAIEHLNHAVSVMGIEHVGIGTDFDGDGGVRGCASASELINLTRHLMRERYTDEQIAMLWGGNFLRVMRQAQANSV